MFYGTIINQKYHLLLSETKIKKFSIVVSIF